MALHGSLLQPNREGPRHARPNSPVPGKGGYAAAMWNLRPQKSLATCAEYRKEEAHLAKSSRRRPLPRLLLSRLSLLQSQPQRQRRDRRRQGQTEKVFAPAEKLIPHDQACRSWDHTGPTYCSGMYGFVPNFVRGAYENGVPPIENTLFRTFLIAVMFAILAVVQGARMTVPRQALPSFIGQSLATLFVSIGYLASVQFIKVGLAVIIFYFFPVLIMICAPLVEGRNPGTSQDPDCGHCLCRAGGGHRAGSRKPRHPGDPSRCRCHVRSSLAVLFGPFHFPAT